MNNRSYIVNAAVTQHVSYTALQVTTIIDSAIAQTPQLVVYREDGTVDQDATMERLIRSALRDQLSFAQQEITLAAKKPNVAVEVWPRGTSLNLLNAPIEELTEILDATTTPAKNED